MVDTAREEIKAAHLEIAEELAAEELSHRSRDLYYRSMIAVDEDSDLGRSGTKTAWSSASKITPIPSIQDIKAVYLINNVTFTQVGDIKVKMNVSNYDIEDLRNYEFALLEGSNYIEYSIIGGTAPIYDKHLSHYIMYLRRKEQNN